MAANFKKTDLSAIVLIALLTLLSSCASRAYTKSHSDIIATAEANGDVITTEEAKRIFKDFRKDNAEKIQALKKSRAHFNFEDDYRIHANDLVEIKVFEVPELNQSIRIPADGYVSLPLIGDTKLAGLSENEAAAQIKRKLSNQLKSPRVLVNIQEFSGDKVSVAGGVNAPGEYALNRGQTTLTNILSKAGGISTKAGNYVTILPERAQSSKADIVNRAKFLLEGTNASKELDGIELSLNEVLGTHGVNRTNFPIRGGDTVIVEQAGQILVEGEVEQRGSYQLSNNMTLIGALAAAGGITYGARVDEVEVVRKVRGELITLVYDLDKIRRRQQENLLLRSSDVVRVPSSDGKRMGQDFFDSVQGFIRFGGRLNQN